MLYALKDLMRIYRVKAEKSLSQNFIFDQQLLRRIAALPPGFPKDDATLVMEVGPAAGNLSRALMSHGYKHILLVEKDLRFKPMLSQLKEYANGKIDIVFDDALNLNPKWIPHDLQIFNHLLIIGNLPFAVATPLTLKFFEAFDHSSTEHSFFHKFAGNVEMVLMYQYEVARKLVARPGSRDYGRLAVLAQTFSNCQLVQKIPRNKFTPTPLVDAALVHFKLKPEMRSRHIFHQLEKFTGQFFRHKNQTNNLTLQGRRPVHIAPEDWLHLASSA